MLTVPGAEGCDWLVDDGGDHSMDAQRDIDLKTAFAKDRTLPRSKPHHEARVQTRLDSHQVQVEGSDHAARSTSCQRSVDVTGQRDRRGGVGIHT